MEVDDLDAAVSAADERLSDLFSDLKMLVATSDAERKQARGRHPSMDAGRMTASTDWDELFGKAVGNTNQEDPPEPRRTPITRPTSREPGRGSPCPWTIDSTAGGESTAATRAMNPTKQTDQNLTLRRAVEDILSADWQRAGKCLPGEDVQDTVRKEKEVTKELRRRMNQMLERRRADSAASQSSTATSSQVNHHECVPSDSRHVSWKAAHDVVFIDPSLLEGNDSGVRRSKQSGARAPWGGGGGRNRQDAVPPTKSLWPRESIVAPKYGKPPWMLPGYRPPEDPSVKLSRFEERCASALRLHLETMNIKKRREQLDDWGVVGGGFEGAEISVQIELMVIHAGDNVKVGGVGGMVLKQGSMRFVPVQPQPLRRLKLFLGDPTSNAVVAGRPAHVCLGWIDVDYDENGMCDLPQLCSSVLYRRRVSGGETDTASRYFVRFSFGEHARIFARAVHLRS